MGYYKEANSGEVFFFESEIDFINSGMTNLIKMNNKDVENHLNQNISINKIEDDVRTRRNKLLAETDWIVIRHRDEVEEGVNPTLSKEEYSFIQVYRRDLRDITNQKGFPTSIHWPIKPN